MKMYALWFTVDDEVRYFQEFDDEKTLRSFAARDDITNAEMFVRTFSGGWVPL